VLLITDVSSVGIFFNHYAYSIPPNIDLCCFYIIGRTFALYKMYITIYYINTLNFRAPFIFAQRICRICALKCAKIKGCAK